MHRPSRHHETKHVASLDAKRLVRNPTGWPDTRMNRHPIRDLPLDSHDAVLGGPMDAL